MRVNIARLRFWVIGLAVLLVAVLVGFVAYARYRAHRFVADLPGRLGVEISRSSNGFTYSQSVKGRVAFTIHASNAVQYKGGANATLHDVVITLYGTQGDRSDRISGSEFDYDQKAGLVTAKGEVQIDLQGADLPGPALSPAPDAGRNIGAASARDVVHVKTSGLVFDRNTEIASTSQYLEFSTPKGGGHATGASYDVQKGLLVLQSGVELDSSRNADPILVRASHAEFLRSSTQAFLLSPSVRYKSGQTAADQATVYLRKDGSAEHVDAQGHVHLKTDGGQEVMARAAKLLLDPQSQPLRADASGGVNFVSTSDTQQMHGNAVEGTVLFGAGGALSHAQARNAVSFVDQQRGFSDDPQGSATRELRAGQVDIDFTRDSKGHDDATKILAGGGAAAVLHTIRTNGASQNTTLKGDQLLASLRDGRVVEDLHGNGHTSVLDISPNGASSLSTGDTLQVSFAPAPEKGGLLPSVKKNPAAGGVPNSTQIQSFIQEGNVVITQTPATGKPGPPAATTRIVARRADYEAANQFLRLTGSPHIDDGSTDIGADSIEYHRDTEVANAGGNVKVTYRQAAAAVSAGSPAAAVSAPGLGGNGPTHVISANAAFDRARGVAVFRGQARLWQGANSVSAPILELSRNPEMLKAYGEPASADAVRTVIAAAAAPQRQPGVFQVRSRQLLYAAADSRATFTGSVVGDDPNGVVHADQVQVFLTPSSQTARTSPPPGNASGIERILATGHVVLEQPGRRGTGEQLLYNAGDGKFTLRGTRAALPHLYDQAHGSVSGEALIFNSQDDSVSVIGGQSGTVTETRTAK